MLDDVFTLENIREETDSEGNNFIYKLRRNAAGARIGVRHVDTFLAAQREAKTI